MTKIVRTALFAALALSTGIASQSMTASDANAWWGCPSGYNLQTANGGSKARCFRPVQVLYQGSTCPQARPPGVNTQVGTQRRTDAQGNRDKCVIFNTPISLDPACAFGYSLQRRTGVDRCRKVIPGHQRAVTVNVP